MYSAKGISTADILLVICLVSDVGLNKSKFIIIFFIIIIIIIIIIVIVVVVVIIIIIIIIIFFFFYYYYKLYKQAEFTGNDESCKEIMLCMK